MREKEILERMVTVEVKQEEINKKLTKIETSLDFLNKNLSSFTQEISLLKANSHNKEECKISLVKEVKKDIFDSFSRVGQFTILLGVIVGGLGAWLKYWLEVK